MKKTIFFLSIFLVCLTLGGCRVSDLPPLGMEEVHELLPSEEGVEEFLKLQTDRTEHYDNDHCWNVTPDFMREHSKYRIFKYSKGCDCYLLYDSIVYPLGQSSGGPGLTSLAMADQNGDGQYEVYYSCSFGSGMYLSSVGYFDPVDRYDHILTPRNLSYSASNLMIACQDGELKVFTADAAGSPEDKEPEHGSARLSHRIGEEIGTVVYRDSKIQLDVLDAWIMEPGPSSSQGPSYPNGKK